MSTLQFPCSHQKIDSHPLKIGIQFYLQVFRRLIGHRLDDAGQRSFVEIIPYHLNTENSIISDPLNPYCAQCHSYIFELMKSLGLFVQDIRQFVNNVLLSLSKEFNYSCDHRNRKYVWNIPIHTTYVCDCEMFIMALAERVPFEEEVKLTPASKASIEALKRSIIKDYENPNCTICFKELYDNKKEAKLLKVTMPCKHEFHEGCIVKWLHNHRFCPLCRFELLVRVSDNS